MWIRGTRSNSRIHAYDPVIELGNPMETEMNNAEISEKETVGERQHLHRHSRRKRRGRRGECVMELHEETYGNGPFSVSDNSNDFTHLAGCDRCDGPGPEPERLSSFDDTTQHNNSSKEQLVRGEEEQRQAIVEQGHTFSLALRECQNSRFRSERNPMLKQQMRPVSLDLSSQGSDASITSPRFYIAGDSMKKSSRVTSYSKSGTFPSPGAPNYRHGHGAAGYPKGWSSERVPLPVNSGRRYGTNTAFTPFGNGRTLPSKWEDAEKWILSPLSGVALKNAPSAPHYRRPKSKSGPLGSPAGVGSHTDSSPLVIQNSAANSPLMTGVLVEDHGCCGGSSAGRGVGVGAGAARSCSESQSDHSIVRSASVHGWSELDSSSLPSSQDENNDSMKDSSTVLPVIVKDVATQMSPDCSIHSSPKKMPTSSPLSPPRSHAATESQSHSLELEVRDVQVDDRVTITRWSRKHIVKGLDKDSTNIIRWKKRTINPRTSAWEAAETVKCITELSREEAKITAWENLQKAKAEAAIQKLEMKLEKKRSSSMEKILEKLRTAQRKAQEMRSIVTAGHVQEDASTNKWTMFFFKTGRMSSLSSCFTCHAF